MPGPVVRPRRLRQSAAVRRLVAETRLHPAELVLPVFVREGAGEPVPISAMPGVVQHSLDSLVTVARQAADAGIGGLMLFGVPQEKDAVGSGADDPQGILNVAVEAVVEAVGDRTVVMADLCLDEFTDHGHCGVLTDDGRVDNDATLERYAAMALAQARAGAHVLGLSGMMDGQVGYVREALDSAGFTDTILLAYSAKYTSGLYGPFREAVESSLEGDRMTYQQDPANATEAVRELELDIAEGADIVMVKPAMPTWTSSARPPRCRRYPWRRTRSRASTRRSRPRRPMAGSTASAPSWSRCSASVGPAPRSSSRTTRSRRPSCCADRAAYPIGRQRRKTASTRGSARGSPRAAPRHRDGVHERVEGEGLDGAALGAGRRRVDDQALDSLDLLHQAERVALER